MPVTVLKNFNENHIAVTTGVFCQNYDHGSLFMCGVSGFQSLMLCFPFPCLPFHSLPLCYLELLWALGLTQLPSISYSSKSPPTLRHRFMVLLLACISNGCIANGCITIGCITNGYITIGCITNGYITNRCITNGYITNGYITIGYITDGSNGCVTNGCITNGYVTNGSNGCTTGANSCAPNRFNQPLTQLLLQNSPGGSMLRLATTLSYLVVHCFHDRLVLENGLEHLQQIKKTRVEHAGWCEKQLGAPVADVQGRSTNAGLLRKNGLGRL